MVRSLGRRPFLRTAIAGAAAGIAGCLGFTGTRDEERLPGAIDLEPVVEGLEAPVDVAFVPGESARYVATQPGRIVVHGPGGLEADPLLDLRDRVVTGTEQGLLGIALHPEFPADRRLFVRYSSPPREGTPSGYSHTAVLASFEVDADRHAAEQASERAVLELPQPQDTHNAGAIAFGPDDYLYVTTGDGGGHVDADPGHAEDWYDGNDGGNGQDVAANLHGSILRIDVDGGDPYAVPPDNPLVGREGRDEQWAWGFRNPWRLSFDGEDCFVGDVGKWRYEEINLVEAGGNYGWNVREGTECFDASDPREPLAECPDETPADVRGGEPLRDPVVEYPHPGVADADLQGVAVVGGYVYRGSALPDLEGRYVFGDLQPDGRLFVGIPPEDDGGAWSAEPVDLVADAAERLDRILSFGRDEDGELYVLGGGSVSRLVSAD